jgi:hypothetical protein
VAASVSPSLDKFVNGKISLANTNLISKVPRKKKKGVV